MISTVELLSFPGNTAKKNKVFMFQLLFLVNELPSLLNLAVAHLFAALHQRCRRTVH